MDACYLAGQPDCPCLHRDLALLPSGAVAVAAGNPGGVTHHGREPARAGRRPSQMERQPVRRATDGRYCAQFPERSCPSLAPPSSLILACCPLMRSRRTSFTLSVREYSLMRNLSSLISLACLDLSSLISLT